MTATEASQYYRAQIVVFRDVYAVMVTAITMSYVKEAIGKAKYAGVVDPLVLSAGTSVRDRLFSLCQQLLA